MMGNSGITASGVQLQRLVDDLGTTLLEVIEAPGPLDAEVTGATIFDAHDDLLISPGELLLGVGVATQAEMTGLIRRLGKLHAAALVVKAPEEVSDELREAVRVHGVPLLGLTRAASWFQVAALLRTLLDRWTATSAGDLAGSPAGDLFAFANAISALVGGPVTVEDRSSHVLAFSGGQEEADTSRIETILGRQVPQRYRQMLEERGIFRELYRSRRPVYMPSLLPGMLPRVAVAVHAGPEVLGSLWVVVKGPLSDERTQALTEAAGLAALHMLHQRNSADLARQLNADLLESVLTGGAAAHQAAIRLGLPPGPLCVLACQPSGAQGAALESASQRLADALALHLGAIHADAAIARIGRLVYAVVPGGHCDPSQAAQRVCALAASFVARIGHRDPVVIGVGGPAQSLPGLARARAEAERTVRVLRDISTRGRAACLDDVYLEAVLDRLGEVLEDDEDRSYGPVARLISYDAENGTELTGSLRAYLEAFGDVANAAAAVHVHPNTFRYRLRRIWEVGGLDLDDPRARLAALVQLSATRRPRG
jgi:PucR C-terminal helix-turn-helix domain/Purine catabolism regulatory protein-like family/GGDEF-like domain